MMGDARRLSVVVVVCGLVAPAVMVRSAGLAAAVGSVVINEVMFNPPDDNPASEYLELVNPGGSAVDVSGWCVDGVDYCFPGGSVLGAGQFVVVSGPQFGGALSNGGEQIVLLDAAGQPVDSVEYDDHDEWPALPDGEGHSLQRRDTAAAGDHPGNWESAAPTPGAPNAVSSTAGLLPTFDDVEHDVLPAAGAPITVTADLEGGATARLVYRVGFGPEVGVDMAVADGVATATIPGQPAGSLVRYRLRAWNGALVGDWPRQGAGSLYVGTTVARAPGSALTTFELFMTAETYEVMAADTSLSGDDGYPLVLAYDGQVFDNAKIRVKGQSSRHWPKKKFKVILAPGQELEDADRFPEPIDEFALHSNWSDRSFLRETLASEFMTAAGMRALQAFPARIELNGDFYGLYTYSEQPDGTYRDRYGLDDSEMWEVGPDNIFGTLAPGDAGLSDAALSARYDKETFEYLGHQTLRDFIAVINGLSGDAKRQWIYANMDVPSVVNAIAASMVIQHQDWGNKNYRLVFDERGRVGVVQNDYDLSWGRRWDMSIGGLDTRVYVGGWWEQPAGPLFGTFFYDPELYSLVARRVRTITEELLAPPAVAARIEQLAAEVRPDALEDRGRWGTYGGSADPTDEAYRIISDFVNPQYDRILGPLASQGRAAATTQPAIPEVRIEHVAWEGLQHIVVRNDSTESVDLSGFVIPALEFTVPGGTVLLPGRRAVFVHEDAEQLAGAFEGIIVAGIFGVDLDDLEDGFALRNRAGDVLQRYDRVAPGTMTEISGQPDASAFVSLVATETTGPGYLQVLGCGDEPRGTSNLNIDGVGQTRAGLALVRFDGEGAACIFNRSATHIVADLQGYLAAAAVDDVADQRLVDTRAGERPAAGALVTLAGRAESTAVLGLVATDTEGPGYLAVVPCAAPNVTTSNLNFDRAGATVSSLAVVRFDAAGQACIRTSAAADVVVDLQAYLVADQFDDVDDARLIDTRVGARPADHSLTVIHGRPDSTGVVSVVATDSAGPGYVQVLPCDATPGATSNLNVDRAGPVIVNALATVRFASDGTACLFTKAATHLVADLQGYFQPGAFDDVPDQRLFDSR